MKQLSLTNKETKRAINTLFEYKKNERDKVHTLKFNELSRGLYYLTKQGESCKLSPELVNFDKQENMEASLKWYYSQYLSGSNKRTIIVESSNKIFLMPAAGSWSNPGIMVIFIETTTEGYSITKAVLKRPSVKQFMKETGWCNYLPHREQVKINGEIYNTPKDIVAFNSYYEKCFGDFDEKGVVQFSRYDIILHNLHKTTEPLIEYILPYIHPDYEKPEVRKELASRVARRWVKTTKEAHVETETNRILNEEINFGPSFELLLEWKNGYDFKNTYEILNFYMPGETEYNTKLAREFEKEFEQKQVEFLGDDYFTANEPISFVVEGDNNMIPLSDEYQSPAEHEIHILVPEEKEEEKEPKKANKQKLRNMVESFTASNPMSEA